MSCYLPCETALTGSSLHFLLPHPTAFKPALTPGYTITAQQNLSYAQTQQDICILSFGLLQQCLPAMNLFQGKMKQRKKVGLKESRLP